MSGAVAKIAVDAAFQRLLAHFGNAHRARERLEAAIRNEDVRLYDRGELVDAGFFATDLCVRTPEKGGRRRAEVWPSRVGLSEPKSVYVWEVAEPDIDAMLAPPMKPKPWLAEAMKPHQQAGRKPTAAARALEPEMRTAAAAGRVTQAMKWPSIRTRLYNLKYSDKI